MSSVQLAAFRGACGVLTAGAPLDSDGETKELQGQLMASGPEVDCRTFPLVKAATYTSYGSPDVVRITEAAASARVLRVCLSDLTLGLAS
jgi:hypothetical protein